MLNLLCMMIYKKGDDTHVTWVMIHKQQISLSMHEKYFSNLVECQGLVVYLLKHFKIYCNSVA